MKRINEPEWLDELPAEDPRALRSRRDLQRLNRLMGHSRMVRQILEPRYAGPAPLRIVELGAGDGTFMLEMAKALPRRDDVTAVLLDFKPAVRNETLAGFKAIGWRVETVVADVFDWLEKPGAPADVIFSNLFLHHFQKDRLSEMLRLIALRTKLFAACEPRRARLPLLLSRFVGLIGCHAVTRRDAVLSFRAGFTNHELSDLWPAQPGWQLNEYQAGLFTHAFVAKCR